MGTTFALLFWVIALLSVIIGVIVSVILYVKGAFKSGHGGRERLESVTLSREAAEAERDFAMSRGATGRPMDAYSLRMLRMFIFMVMGVALFFIALVISLAGR